MYKLTRLFGGTPLRKESKGITLISVHIPKTAGTSFRTYLKKVYPATSVARVDLRSKSTVVKLEQEPYDKEKLPANIKVVHGHFNYPELKSRLDLPEQVMIITWLRHPVDRVISNYFYLKARLEEELDEKGKGLNILAKMQRTLLEYARAEPNRNRQAKFLRGMSLRDFDFVGIQEYFAEDIEQMARHFFWDPSVQVPKVNVTPRRNEVSEAEREEILRLNQEDLQLYEEGLQLRAQRHAAFRPELISIHLPKTGGTSFYAYLRAVYGPDLSISLTRKKIKKAQRYFDSPNAYFNQNIRAVHGHFHYAEIKPIHDKYSPKLVCWLRDPVDRVISNYLHNTSSRNYPPGRKKPDLMTYAQRPETRNKMSRFLEGIDLREFLFIGFQEHFATDLQRLSKLMNWPQLPPPKLNVSTSDRKKALVVTPVMREKIVALNAEDVALYQYALTLRGDKS